MKFYVKYEFADGHEENWCVFGDTIYDVDHARALRSSIHKCTALVRIWYSTHTFGEMEVLEVPLGDLAGLVYEATK